MATFEPFAESTAAGMSINGGQTTISSRSCPATSGKKSRKKFRDWSGVLYIFQLAAITFVLMEILFQSSVEIWRLPCAISRRRRCRLSASRYQREQTVHEVLARPTLTPRPLLQALPELPRGPDNRRPPSRSTEKPENVWHGRRRSESNSGNNSPASLPRHHHRAHRPAPRCE